MSMHGIPVYGQNIPQNIPFAKSVSSKSLTLPSVGTRIPTPQNPFDDVYKDTNYTNSLIQTRLNKLEQEKNMLNQVKETYNPYIPDFASLGNLRTLANAKGQLANPNLYSHSFMDPIYYPLEMPISAEPVTLPKIEMGHPMMKKKKDCGMGIEDILALIAMMRKNVQVPIQLPPPQIQLPPRPRRISKYIDDHNKKVTIPETIKPEKKINPPRMRRDWWRLCRDFVNLYNFISTSRKYAQHSKVRDNMINNRAKSSIQELSVLKDWMISINKSLWDEFMVFRDLNLSFKNIDSKLKIQEKSQKIIPFIKKFLENIIQNTRKTSDIPQRVRQILYNYIKERAYYPKKFLSTYLINRLDFNFYGSTRQVTEEQQGMLIAVLLISVVTVQQILLNIRDVFVEFKNYPNIDISAKYLGSILHYLTRDTFNNNPTMLKEFLALLNYYRNYHIYNEQVEKQDDIYNNNMVFIDNDEYSRNLVPENNITEFWNLNTEFINNVFKKYVYPWACHLGKIIKQKMSAEDPDLFERRRLTPPPEKTAMIEITKGPRKKIGEEIYYDDD